MTERPIIFSAPMVRAILEGRKTQTRRVLKPQPEQNEAGLWVFPPRWTATAFKKWGQAAQTDDAGLRILFQSERPKEALPYAVGDRLWVRETFVTGYDIEDESGIPVGELKVWYRATDAGLRWYDPDSETTLDKPAWKPSIFMPRWASRITLEVTGVKVERLQDINRGDAMEEGCPFPNMAKGPNPRDWFQDLWASIHGPGAWEANPWVVAITFERAH